LTFQTCFLVNIEANNMSNGINNSNVIMNRI